MYIQQGYSKVDKAMQFCLKLSMKIVQHIADCSIRVLH